LVLLRFILILLQLFATPIVFRGILRAWYFVSFAGFALLVLLDSVYLNELVNVLLAISIEFGDPVSGEKKINMASVRSRS